MGFVKNLKSGLASLLSRIAGRLDGRYGDPERRLSETAAELEDTRRRVEDLEKLRNEIMSITSHELRSPLASMKMGVSTVLKEIVGPLTDDQRTVLAVTDRNIEQLDRLTSSLLELARIESGGKDFKYAERDLVELAREVVESNLPEAERSGLQLKTAFEAEAVVALCDRDRIYQVLRNFVENALKFTVEGTVTVSVSKRGGMVRVCVDDTGPGIPEEVLGSVFEKFSDAHMQTQSDKRGAGLGLAISRGIVELHGGSVSAESEVGKGSRFCFDIPARGLDERKQEDTDSR